MKTARLFFSLFILGFLCSLPAHGQGSAPWEYWRNVQVPVTDYSTASSSVTITDNFIVQDMHVVVDVDHSAAGDLLITLNGPLGNFVISQYNGGIYDDYNNTIFDPNVTAYHPATNPTGAIPGLPVDAASNQTAYYRGVYKPQSGTNFNAVLGNSPAGTWTLQVYDNASGDIGTLMKWGLVFNRYGKYKDSRFGWDINFFSGGLPRMPPPFVDDVTYFSPQGLYPYRVHGYRPEQNRILAAFSFQNSKTASVTKFTFQPVHPGNMMQPPLYLEANANIGLFAIPAMFTLPSLAGQYKVNANAYQRTDLFMTRSDNSISRSVELTAGSMGYDNGMNAGSTNIPVNNCEASVFILEVPQTLTSVDVYQDGNVELEPPASNARVSVRAWDATTGQPGTMVVSTGMRQLPTQGNKWVTYDFSPPVSLPAGKYAFGICTDAPPTVGGVGLGNDREGSPFDIDGTLGRYYNLGVEWYSLNNGTSWNPEFLRQYGGKMIRPNFIMNSDVGVISIDAPPANLPASFAPVVTFGAFAHHPNLPNLVTFGKVYIINNATNQVVGYSERRVFLQNAPFITSITFDTFNNLPAGSYTIKAVVERADDENLINNTYSRQYTRPFAPVIVSHSRSIPADLKQRIEDNFRDIGSEIVFKDRSLGFEFPAEGQILWIGSLSSTEAASARHFAEAGNEFAVLATKDYSGDIQTNVFASLASSEEYEHMQSTLKQVRETETPEFKIPPELTDMFENGSVVVLSKSDESRIEVAERVMSSFSDLKSRLELMSELPRVDAGNRNFGTNHSESFRVEGSRIGDLSVVRLLTEKKSAPRRLVESIINPSAFELSQNYPNPFNPSTNIAYNLTTDANVSILVFDVLGRQVATLVNNTQNTGQYIVSWNGETDNGTAVASGVYLYRMEATPLNGSAPFVTSKKMVLSQ